MRTDHVFTYSANNIAAAATKKADYYADKAELAKKRFVAAQIAYTLHDWQEIFKYLRGNMDNKNRDAFIGTWLPQFNQILDAIDSLADNEAKEKEYRQLAAACSKQGTTLYELSYADVLYFGLAE